MTKFFSLKTKILFGNQIIYTIDSKNNIFKKENIFF